MMPAWLERTLRMETANDRRLVLALLFSVAWAIGWTVTKVT
jgi:hypothetical protein